MIKGQIGDPFGRGNGDHALSRSGLKVGIAPSMTCCITAANSVISLSLNTLTGTDAL